MNSNVPISDVMQSAEALVRMAIAEDIRTGDVTSRSILPRGHRNRAIFLVKADGVIAGIPIAKLVYAHIEPLIKFVHKVDDGVPVKAGQILAQLEGPAIGLLAGERTALNFLQHLSGIATLTAAFVRAVAGTRAVILDTRKTLPGYRLLEKYAVRLGGGQNHRIGLYDMALIKDNHIAAAGSISMAVRRVRGMEPNVPVEVEVTNLDQLREALVLPVDRIMLDNMDVAAMREAVRLTAGRVGLEASGGVNLDTVAEVAATGVNFISIGELTHSAPALDISMEITG
jgi:nicotinate-nucleotide pyrophosphorylase (carboxylating)